MKAGDMAGILSQMKSSTEVYIRIGDDAYPAKLMVFKENDKLVPYLTIENTDEHRNFPARYGAKEVTETLT